MRALVSNTDQSWFDFLSSLIAVLAERLESVDLNSPLLIDAEALSRELAEADQAAAARTRRARPASGLGNDAATL